MPAPGKPCGNCTHLLRWHRTHDGECLHDGCDCERFVAAAASSRRRKPGSMQPDVLDKCCAVCRNGQHGNCSGRMIKPGCTKSPSAPRVRCECPRHKGAGA